MKLLYCYTEFLNQKGEPSPYRCLDKLRLNLSSRERFELDEADKLVRMERETPLPPKFWANPGPENWKKSNPKEVDNAKQSDPEQEPDTNIRSINVVTGENGAGKSTVMQYLIDLLDAIHDACGGYEKDQARRPRHPVWQHRNLLLFDCSSGDGIPEYFLFDYVPEAAAGREEADPVNFPVGALLPGEMRLFSRSRSDISERQSPCKNLLKALLDRTKLIYMTNTLTQRDYLRNFERNQGWTDPQVLRTAFVYDCSTGASVGREIAQYFPYEVYKQVRYVFDRSQYEIRKQLGEKIRELRMPLGLTLRLRMDEFPRMNEQYQICDWDEQEIRETIKRSSHGFSWKKPSLARKLGALAAAACEKNLKSALDFNLRKNERASMSQIQQELRWENIHKDIYSLAEAFYRMDLRCIQQSEDGLVFSDSSQRIPMDLEKNNEPASCMTYGPNNQLIIGWKSGRVSVWNQYSGEENRNWPGCGSSVSCLACEGYDQILIGCEDGSLWLWNLEGMSIQQLPRKRCSAIRCAALFYDWWGIIGGTDGALELWDLQTQTQISDLTHPTGVNCLLILSENSVLVGGVDGTLRVWNLRSGDSALWSERHGDKVTCLAKGSGNSVISGSADGTLRVWELESGKCVTVFEQHGEAVTAVITYSSGLVISGSDNGQLLIWDERTPERVISFQQAEGRLLSLSSRSQNRKSSLIWNLILCTEDYLDFLESEENILFSHFREDDPRTYTLTLEEVQKDESLYDRIIRFVQKYRYICEPAYTVDFDWGLSSGEDNMLRLFSELFYVFDRDYSSGKYGNHQIYNLNNNSQGNVLTACDSVLLFMDEADLTFHPEWQRRLIYLLTAVLPAVYPKSCVGDIQLLLSTHSPLLLGDLPRENITCMVARERNGVRPERTCEILEGETFGQNIHTILRESFFLKNGTVGAFAAGKINRLAWELEELQARLAGDTVQTETMRSRLSELRSQIRLVAPGILRGRLEFMFSGVEAALDPDREKLLEALKLISPEERRHLLQRLEKET